MRAIFATLALSAALVAGCAAQGQALSSTSAGGGGVMVVATLAPLGSFEWHAAPTLTQITAARQRAASLLRSGRLDIEGARQVQLLADRGRAKWDQALAVDRAGDRAAAHSLLEEAAAFASAATTYLERNTR